MGLERLLFAAGTIALLAGSASAQKGWESFEPYRTKEGKDTTVLFMYTQVGNNVSRINTYTRQVEPVVNGLVLSSNRSLELQTGDFVSKRYSDGSSVSGAVKSNKHIADADEERMKKYREELEEQNQTPEKLYELAQLQYKEGNYDSAKSLLEKAIVKDSTKAEYFDRLGHSYRHLGPDYWDKALENYYISIKLNPKQGDSYAGIGGIFADPKFHDQSKEKAYEAWKKGEELGNSYCIENIKTFDNICKEAGLK